MKAINVLTALNGSDTEAITVSDSIWTQDLIANTPVTVSVPVPTQTRMVICQFIGVGPVYARFGGVQMAAKPASGAIDDQVMNPYARIIEGGVTEIHFVADTDGRLSLEFFR